MDLLNDPTFIQAVVKKRKGIIEDVTNQMTNANMQPTVHTIKRGLQVTGQVLPAQHIEGFRKMWQSVRALKRLNPTVSVKLELDAMHAFKSLTVVLPHSRAAMDHLYKVVGLDAAHCKRILIKKKPRTLLKQNTLSMLTGRTFNNSIIILAYTISYSENAEDMSALLTHCLETGLPLNNSNMVVLSDRGGAIGKAVVLNAHQRKPFVL